ncbi:MAG: hypothetical protein DRI37_06280 [Chloroflexi bacterium]|nr:MAG: hypothetical protein DRI37_06280 [Chloroflexota bacterium]
MIGIPWNQDRQCIRKGGDGDLWESEASRMVRCIAALVDVNLKDPENYNLKLTPAERQKAEKELKKWDGNDIFIAASIGTKADTKDWGRENWSSLFTRWCRCHPGVGLAMVGSTDKYDISGKNAKNWKGRDLICVVS